MKRITICLLLAALAAPTSAEEAPAPTLSKQELASPQKTMQVFLDHARKSSPQHDLSVAAQCLELSRIPAKTEEDRLQQGAELAEMLVSALDAKGYYVNWQGLPDETQAKATSVRIHDETPFYLILKDGKWLLSATSVGEIKPFFDSVFPRQVRWIIELLPPFMRKQLLGLFYWQVVAVFLLLLLAFIARRIAIHIGDNYFVRLAERTRFRLDQDILKALVKPIGLLLFAGVILAGFPNLQFGLRISRTVRVAMLCVTAFSVIWIVYRLVDVLASYLEGLTARTDSKLDDQLVPIIRKTLKAFVVIIGVIFVLQNLQVDVTSFVAGLGIGGLAIALAAQDTLSNLFGSVMILVDRPFQIGDWVIIGDVEGTVEEVGLRSTRIRTFYKSLVTIPNSQLVKTSVDNMGARTYRRIKTYISVTYDTPPEKIEAFVEGIRQIIHANEHTWKDYYHVYFNQFAAASLDILLYCFVDTKDWGVELHERHRLFLEIVRLAEKLGVEFAFPTQTLHIRSFPGQPSEPVTREQAAKELADIAAAFGPGGQHAQSIDMKALAEESRD